MVTLLVFVNSFNCASAVSFVLQQLEHLLDLLDSLQSLFLSSV